MPYDTKLAGRVREYLKAIPNIEVAQHLLPSRDALIALCVTCGLSGVVECKL